MTMMDEYRHDVTFLHFFQISENAIYGTCVINTAIRDKLCKVVKKDRLDTFFFCFFQKSILEPFIQNIYILM